MARLTITEAAKLLGVSTRTLLRWEEKGKITSIRTPGGHRRYDSAKLLAETSSSEHQIHMSAPEEFSRSNQYSIAQVRHHITEIVEEIEKKASVEITDKGKSVAVMMSIDEYNRLVAGNSGFWQALLKFREEVDLEEEEIDPAIFESVRDTSPGREVVW